MNPIFVYRLKETGQIKCAYIEDARIMEDDPEWEHIDTLEPLAWIEHNYQKVTA